MPVPYLKKLAHKHGVSIQTAEARWEKAKKIAAEAGHADNYAYITGVAKKMFSESFPGISKLIANLVDDIRAGRMDPDEAASLLAETVTSGSVGGFIAGGFVHGYTGTPFPTGTRDRNGIPNMPSWGNAAEQVSAKNLPGRKKHKKKHHKRKHLRESVGANDDPAKAIIMVDHDAKLASGSTVDGFTLASLARKHSGESGSYQGCGKVRPTDTTHRHLLLFRDSMAGEEAFKGIKKAMHPDHVSKVSFSSS